MLFRFRGTQAFIKSKIRQIVNGFTQKVNTMSNSSRPIELQPGIVFIQDCNSNEMSKLYTLDLSTGKATLIGEVITEVYDIAFVGSQLYGLDREGNKTRLIKIDLNSGDTTVVGDIGFITAGLAYNHKRQTLYATTAKQLISINLETGQGTVAVTVADKDYNCGEVAFDADGTAYITLIGYDKKKVLARCNLDAGEVTRIGDTGFPGLASLEFVGNVLYGVTGKFFNLGKDGQLIRIDTNTGKGTLVTTTNPIGRWAGMAIYQPVTQDKSEQSSTITPSPQTDKTIQEDAMKLLTIDTKNNCYVIDPDGMNQLQQNVAKSFTLEKGTFDIQIANGRYSHAKSETQGEPFVLLWIYGVDGNTFINKNTGIEVGATWTTLNGNNDRLQLEVKEKAVLCALFFDLSNTDNSGSIELLITSNKEFFNPQTLVVDSKKNCYVLNEQHLSSLRQWDSNFIELNPGNYRIKIREANATYWSNEQKFQLEPWALMWIKGGKFIPKLTGIEVEDTWCSLNGLKDELIVEVKGKTTLSGFFFDTYKDDNEGQIILAIEPISATELAQISERTKITEKVTTETAINESKTSVGITGSVSNIGGESISVTGGGVSFGSTGSFTFRFDEAQMEEMWKNLASKIETSVTLPDKQDGNKTQYWNNLEGWILQRYQDQAKQLAMQVARVEFMMKALTQQMEVSFNQTFQGWSSYFDQRLERLISTRIATVVEEQVNLKVTKQTQDIKKLVIEQMQSELEKRIEATLNLKITKQTQDIKKLVVEQMQADITKQIETTLNLKITDQSKEINNQVIKQIQGEMDKRIESVVNLKIDAQTENIKNLVIQQIEADIDRRLDTTVNLKIDAQTENIKNLVIQQIEADIDRRLDTTVNLKIDAQTENIKNLVIQQIEVDIDRRLDTTVNLKIDAQIENIKNLVIQQLQADINRRLESVVNLKIDAQTQNIKNLVIQQLQADIDKRLESVVNLKIDAQTQNIKNLVIQQLQADIDKRLESVVNLKITDRIENIKNLVIQQLQVDIDNRITSIVDQSRDNNVQLVVNNIMGDIDNRINVNFENKILNFREDVSSIVRNEINQNYTDSITTNVLSEIKKQQFYLDMQLIKAEVENFYARLGQFETQVNIRINQGDTRLYNWTLEQLIGLQGCITDRQALVELFESFSTNLKTVLDGAPCVRPSRFTQWVTTEGQPQFQPIQPPQLPESQQGN
jgi:hypothetical protein